MKPVRNIPVSSVLSGRACGALMEVQIKGDEHEITFRTQYDLDMLIAGLMEIKRKYPQLKAETRNNKTDVRMLELTFIKSVSVYGGDIVLMRGLSKQTKVVYPEKSNRIALAPIVTLRGEKGEFLEYDEQHGGDEE